jgi:hypothetical protein
MRAVLSGLTAKTRILRLNQMLIPAFPLHSLPANLADGYPMSKIKFVKAFTTDNVNILQKVQNYN